MKRRGRDRSASLTDRRKPKTYVTSSHGRAILTKHQQRYGDRSRRSITINLATVHELQLAEQEKDMWYLCRAHYFAWIISFGQLTSLPAWSQSCQQVCDRYSEFAKKAGAPESITPLVQLYEACMQCSQGPGKLDCTFTPAQGPGNNMRCSYEAPAKQEKVSPNR